MKLKLLLFPVLVFLCAEVFSISGTIDSTNNHWGVGGNVTGPVFIDGMVTIGQNTTLLIEPGTRIIFAKPSGISLMGKNAKLVAKGNLSNFIEFEPDSSTKDSSFYLYYRIDMFDSAIVDFKFCKMANITLRFESASQVNIHNCIMGNCFLQMYRSFPLITNNTLYQTDIYVAAEAGPIISNNIIGSMGCFYQDLGTLIKFNLVTSLDPKDFLKGCAIWSDTNMVSRNIVGDAKFIDSANGDFHLLPKSPAIDAGDPTSDFSLEPEGGGGRIDVGVYGNTPEATLKSARVDQGQRQTIIAFFSSSPNPFATRTTISWDGKGDTGVRVQVFNLQGRAVAIFNDCEKHSVIWDASKFPSGLYTAKITHRNSTVIRKLVLAK